ncbi:MAG: methyltransferase domain-containing protein [Spirochaetales bacterium]|nr:methyltransferase domain-containing protein [Spirochaetales bacterium]
MAQKDWNPDLYLKFNKERIQPSIDLVSRIEINEPEKMIDIGCGPGNSTQILAGRWPESKLLGIDKSEAMIAKAEADFPKQKWKIFDVEAEEFNDSYNIVYSNAAIQWMGQHEQLLKKLSDIVKPEGALAVQVPLFYSMPLSDSISRVATLPKWQPKTGSVDRLFTILSSSEYYDILSNLFARVEMWQTDYIHIMESHSSILEMMKSTGLKPYLEKLESESDKKEFTETVLGEIKKDYPMQKDGKVLFPFIRLFFVGYK